MQYRRALMRTSDRKNGDSLYHIDSGRRGGRKGLPQVSAPGWHLVEDKQLAGKFGPKKAKKWNFWARSNPLFPWYENSRWLAVLTVQPPILAIRRNLLASLLGRGQTIHVQRLIGRTQSAWYVSLARKPEPGGSRYYKAWTIGWAQKPRAKYQAIS